MVVFTCNAFLVIIFAIAPGISVLEARDSNSLSDDRRQPRLFLYCPHTTTLYLSGCNSLVSVFPSDGSREWYIRWFRFFSNLIKRSSGTAISCCSVLVVCPVSYFHMRGFQFFRFIRYFVLRCLVLVPPSFIHAESVHEFALLACCYSRWVNFLRYALL